MDKYRERKNGLRKILTVVILMLITFAKPAIARNETLSETLLENQGLILRPQDFNDVNSLLEMQMDKAERIWQSPWPKGDYKTLARRYAKATKSVLGYIPSAISSKDLVAEIEGLAETVETPNQLNKVRKLYHKAFRAMEQAVLDEADKNIRKYRMGTLIIRTQPNAKVKVEQLRHDFLFGTALNDQMWATKEDFDMPRRWYNDFAWLNDKDRYEFIEQNREKYYKLLKDNFNYAVPQNAAKWFNVEPELGNIYWTSLERMCQWCMQNDIRMRGHCIIWGLPKYTPAWHKGMDKAELRRHIERRCKEVVNWFVGRIDEWDLNNEMVHFRWYEQQLGDNIEGDMFRWAKQANPDVVLTLNDYNILNNKYTSDLDKYLEQVQDFLAKGYHVGGINCQSHHFNGETNIGFVKYALDKLAETGLPLKASEYIIDNQGDNPQYAALMLDKHFRVIFSNPAVEAILFWGDWQGTHYSPEHALWNMDFSPKPAATAYRNLVFKKWWTTWQGTADQAGRCELPAFFGRYKIEANEKETVIDFPKSQGPEKTIDM